MEIAQPEDGDPIPWRFRGMRGDLTMGDEQ
jgi:hypothetical protein